MTFFSKSPEKPDFLFEKWDIAEPDLMLGRISRHHLRAETLSNEKHCPEFYPSYFALGDMHTILNRISDHMVQSGNSNPHISKNTNILTLKMCVEYVLSHIQTFSTLFIHKFEGEKMGRFWGRSF